MLSDIVASLSMSFTPEVVFVLFVGVVFGCIIGAMPGLGTCVAIVVCLPFTLQLEPISAIALLMGVYGSSIYGGSISAVLINTPGTPQSAATGMDGYPMARKGQAAQALGWVTSASIVGGLLSCLALMLAAPQLAALSLKYGGPLEITGLICMGLACISSLSEGNQVKGILMGIGGLLLATIGNDPVSGEMRFLFGSENLAGGIALMPVVVGIFPLAEVFVRIHELRAEKIKTPVSCKKIIFPKLKEWKTRTANLFRSSAIGIGLGILPGVGATASTFVSYTTAKKLSPRGDNFGKGEPDGLIAAEASNNAITGGALIPTLALGIPGEPATALMLASMTLHGIVPGVRLMVDNPKVVYSCFILLIIANLLIIPASLIVIRAFGKIINFPPPVLLGLIVVCSLVGVYIPSGVFFDVPVALAIGLLAFAMRLYEFPITPLLIGYVLGPQLEFNMSQAAIYKGDMSLPAYLGSSPLAIVLFTVAALFLLMPILKSTLLAARKSSS
ncbi:tripartite tricarboxylate transporter permease [Desulfopila sp. IMCC35008]|uniref:tripartite tricarboxylate transporter permease n=1 Tax=Desulfopila sp. IMCC35008 TaxID=2653858 RepID=UPI0013D289DD|nr:tripartite tricarboxylate transporter permease [Desulfopila sp. IMCC35008]